MSINCRYMQLLDSVSSSENTHLLLSRQFMCHPGRYKQSEDISSLQKNPELACGADNISVKDKNIRRTLFNEVGTSLLEMIMFLPLVIIFLFLIVDGSFMFIDRAAIRDAIRGGLDSQVLTNRESGAIVFDTTGYSINEPVVKLAASQVGNQIQENIAARRGKDNTHQTVKILVIPVILEFDPNTGELNNHRTVPDLAWESGNFQLTKEVPTFQYLDVKGYLEKQLNSKGEYRAIKRVEAVTTEQADRYCPLLAAVYVEVVGRAQGINPVATSSILGRLYAFEEQGFELFRVQLR